MSTLDAATARLLSLAEQVCHNFNDVRVTGILTSLENLRRNQQILCINSKNKQADIPIDIDFLESSGDDTVISYLSTAIDYNFGEMQQ
jgi:hypothetical protein